jgi:hypothetical protein
MRKDIARNSLQSYQFYPRHTSRGSGGGCLICSIEGEREPDAEGVMAPKPPAFLISPACSRCSSVNFKTPEINWRISKRFWSPRGMFKKLINRFEMSGLDLEEKTKSRLV